MKLIAGLGNPGREYANTRHNSGFLAMDYLLDKLGVSLSQEKWHALIATVRIEGEPVLLMKPLTYMNESGRAVAEAVNFYHIEPEDILRTNRMMYAASILAVLLCMVVSCALMVLSGGP